MGAYVSKDLCQAHHNTTFDCDITSGNFTAGITRGKFESNPDIAGVGVLAAFFIISSLALVASIFYLYKQAEAIKDGQLPRVRCLMQNLPVDGSNEISRPAEKISSFSRMENIILSCSDQQIFTSGAYAITLRWAQCCSISAYHYNIVGNMMLIGCATHLLSMIVVSEYWKIKSVAIIRIILVGILYALTGIILTNQNVGSGPNTWPSGVPNQNESSSTMILPAACFLSKDSLFMDSLNRTFATTKSFEIAVVDSTPGNHIVGWNLWILMLLFYILSFLVDFIRTCCNRYRSAVTRYRVRWFGPRASKFICWIFWGYQVLGTILCGSALVNSFKYILKLRGWMDASGWIEPDIGGKNPENDPTSFGQMVPLLMILMTFFTFLQDRSEKLAQGRKGQRDSDIYPQSFELVPSHADTESQASIPHASPFGFPKEKKNDVMVSVVSVPSPPVLGNDNVENQRATIYRTTSTHSVTHPDITTGTRSLHSRSSSLFLERSD
ncbi:hypothetical protein NHQ30_003632 [Ciborinia camelliae]|nr:hypothetical protein NHQ30_003632 [Ciborinia camelliae]